MAKELDLDLVEVAPMANPPVCRIMDYGKFRYEEAQKAKESRKKSTNVSIKEVKFKPKIGRGDFDTKVRKIDQFLHEGHKVKVTMQFRGREMAHPELGSKILDDVLGHVGDHVKVETQARLEGRNMSMVLAPERKRGAEGRATGPAEPTPTPSGDGEQPGRQWRRHPSNRAGDHPASLIAPITTEPTTTAADTRSTPMPKMKTSKTAAKRFKTTGSGRLRRAQQMNQHKFYEKSSTRKRRVKSDADVHGADLPRIKRLLGER